LAGGVEPSPAGGKMAYREIEIKLEIKEVDPIKSQLGKLGFKVKKPEYFESNIVWDTPDHQLRKSGCLLRLRKEDTGGILTFKRPVPEKEKTASYKIREEIETRFSDFDKGREIFSALGFQVFFRYEKYREIYEKNSIIVTVDRTPIGNFIEIEGAEDSIDDVALQLGYSKRDYIVDSYYVLFRKHHKSGFMIFK
jgi:adenylate cyclase class 2